MTETRVTNDAANPRPLRTVVGQVKGWVERLGWVWVEAQIIEINRRQGPTQFLTLRDRVAEVSVRVTCTSAILDAAALGFLGLGVQPPTPEWGTMLASARDYIERAWWVVSLPGLTILLSVLAINLMGDGLRDALDPKLKNAQ